MAKVLPDQSRGREIDPAEQRVERRLAHIRDYVAKHAPSARHINPDDEWMTEKQLLTAPLSVYHCSDGEFEYVVSKKVFRDVVCDGISWRRTLEILLIAGLLNRSHVGLLAVRVFAPPLDIALVVSIKPDLLKYRTKEEEQTLGNQRQS